MNKHDRPLRVLQIHGSLCRSGQETWLMDIVRNTRREEFVFDVCLTSTVKGAYEEEFQRLGGKIFRCPLKSGIWSFSGCFKKLLETERFDVVHSHHYYFSGLILQIAARAGVAKRIAHIHPIEDLRSHEHFRKIFKWWMKKWICRYSTNIVGPSIGSLEGFCGPCWQEDGRNHVIYNGICIERFIQKADRVAIRRELNMPENAPLVINVGRYTPHKRHEFLIQVAEQVLGQRSDVYFLLVGAGSLKEKIEAMVRSKGLENNFRFISGATNIDRYWMAADVLAFPSCNEGFGIVVIEAAAAGLRVIAQDIPGIREAAGVCVEPALLSLETTADKWARVVLETLKKPRITEAQRQQILKDFPFSIEKSVDKLREVYDV